MICQFCQGKGTVERPERIDCYIDAQHAASGKSPFSYHGPLRPVPCPECGGCGINYCCEGLSANNEVNGYDPGSGIPSKRSGDLE